MKINFLVLFLLIILIDRGFSKPTSVTFNDKPVYRCTISGLTCTFSKVILNETHYEWIPTSDDSDVVRTVEFSDSTMTVVTKGICEEFKFLRELKITGQNVEEIKEDAFHACYGLTILRLYINKIKKIHANTFLYTKNLEQLELYENQIKKLGDYQIFSNLQNLTHLHFGRNNLTEFSPELIRYNKNLLHIYVYSNDLSELEVETILDFVPNLQRLSLDDNEISCTRLVQIFELLESKDIEFHLTANYKVRYYPREIILGSLKCNPDISWMASNYRKENSKLDQRLKVISAMNQELLEVHESNLEMKNELSSVNLKFDKRLRQLDEKLIEIMTIVQKSLKN